MGRWGGLCPFDWPGKKGKEVSGRRGDYFGVSHTFPTARMTHRM